MTLGFIKDLSLAQVVGAARFLAKKNDGLTRLRMLQLLVHDGPPSTELEEPEKLPKDKDRKRRKEPQQRDRTSDFVHPGTQEETDVSKGEEPHTGSLSSELNTALAKTKAFRGGVERWQSRGTRPVHFPLVRPNSMRAVLAAMGTQEMFASQIDIRRLVDAVAKRQLPRRLPRKRRLGFGSKLVIFSDRGPGMIPFQPDMIDFVEKCKCLLGAHRIVEGEIKANGRIDAIELVEQRSTLIIMSDLQGFARRFSYDHTRYHEWNKLMARINMTSSRAVVLSPGSPDDKVPKPAFDDLFKGKKPRLAPIVPWDNSLTASRTAAFVRCTRFPDKRPGNPIAKDPGNPAYLLLRLAATVHDIDQYTLRTLRLVLSSSRSIFDGYQDDIESGHSLKSWDAKADLPSVKPEAGAYHEYAIWISPYMAHRGSTGLLSDKIKKIRKTSFKGAPNDWNEYVAFARAALLRARAGRGLDQLLGDHYLWAKSPDRLDTEKATEELRNLQRLGSLLAKDDGSPHRMEYIDEDFLPSAIIGPGSPLKKPPVLTLTKNGDFLYVGIDMEKSDIRLPLKEGYDLKNGTIELWVSSSASKPVTVENLWPVSNRISLINPDGGKELSTVVVRMGDQISAFNLDASLAEMQPLFSLEVDRSDKNDKLTARNSETLRFDGKDIVFSGRRYDPIGLWDLGEADDIIEADFEPAEELEKISTGGQPVWLDNNHTLFMQPDPTSPLVSSIDIPFPDKQAVNFRAAAQGGHACLSGRNSVWIMISNGEALEVARWKIGVLQNYTTKLAISLAGALMTEHFEQDAHRLHFFPAVAPNTKSVVSVTTAAIQTIPTEMAISDTGLIALYSDNKLAVYEPLTTLGHKSGKAVLDMDAAVGSSRSFKASIIRNYTRGWLTAEKHKLESTIEALCSSDLDNAFRFGRSLNDWDIVLEPQELERITGLSYGEASLVAHIFAQNSHAIRDAGVQGANFQLILPLSGLTLLHIACFLHVPGDLVPILLDFGCSPNARDSFGRTPLYFSAFAKDAGQAMDHLLAAGADPSLNGKYGDLEVGPLAPALFECEKYKPFLKITLDRLLSQGADTLAYGGTTKDTALMWAASRSNSDHFLRLLELDHLRLDAQTRDGVSVLKIASCYGRKEHVRLLLERGVDVDLHDDDGRTALLDAVRNGHADCVKLLLSYKAKPNGIISKADGESRQPLTALLNSHNEIDEEAVRDISTALAKAGANPDCSPWPFTGLIRYRDFDINSRTRMVLDAFVKAVHAIGLVETTRNFLKNRFYSRDIDLANLLELPINFDAVGRDGIRLVHLIAAYSKEMEGDQAQQLMLEFAKRGVNILAGDENGSTAMHYACAVGNADLVRVLQEIEPALADKARTDGSLPSEVAVGFSYYALAKKLSDQLIVQPKTVRQRSLRSQPMAMLSFLSPDADWQDIKSDPQCRFVGVNLNHPLPLPSDLKEIWTTLLIREATLPYEDQRRIRETWWYREDGVVGVSAEVRSSKGKVIFKVDGKSLPIHEMNRGSAPLLETKADALNYLRFFCHAVHGEEGAYALCDNKENLMGHIAGLELSFDKDFLPEYGLKIRRVKERDEKKAATKKLRTKEKGGKSQNDWRIDATIRYSNGLFRAKFRVMTSGMVEMLDDELLGEWSNEEGNVFKSDAGIYCYE